MICVIIIIINNNAFSFCYSGVLFLIVASESTQIKDASHSEKNETYGVYNNITINPINYEEGFESSTTLNTKIENAETLKASQNDQHRQVRFI